MFYFIRFYFHKIADVTTSSHDFHFSPHPHVTNVLRTPFNIPIHIFLPNDFTRITSNIHTSFDVLHRTVIILNVRNDWHRTTEGIFNKHNTSERHATTRSDILPRSYFVIVDISWWISSTFPITDLISILWELSVSGRISHQINDEYNGFACTVPSCRSH